MRDADKPFIAYRQGRWNLKIVPRNGRGWWLMLLWSLPLVPVATGFAWGASRIGEGPTLILVIAAFVAAMIIWMVTMMRWMLARSEQVQIEDLLALKRERDAQKGRRS